MSEGIEPEIVLNEFGELSRKSRRELLAQGIDPDTAVIEHIRTQSIPVITPAVAEAYALRHDVAEKPVVEEPVVVERVVPERVVVEPVVVEPVVVEKVVAFDQPVSVVESPPENSAPVFAPTLSRRDMRNLRERTTNDPEISQTPVEPSNPVVSNPVVSVPESVDAFVVRQEVVREEVVRQEVVREEVVRQEVVREEVVREEVIVDELVIEHVEATSAAPQTIAEATAAIAISQSIERRRRNDESSDIVIDYREDLSDVTDDYEPFSITTMSTQSTGIIPTTGSALILPTLPENAPGARSSFNHTGEILITGSIMLPSGIGQYGADVLSLDTSEIDIIADDEEISSGQDLAPVSASSAVSAYNTSNTVVTVPSKFRDRLPLVLAITAAGLAVGVAALFVTGYVLGVF